MRDEFDAWLTSELESGLGSERPRARFAPARRSRGLTLKAAMVAVAAVLLTGGAALAAGTAVTGTPNPAVWGQQVQSHVQACQQQLASGQHGLGHCVSEFAKQHGQQEKAAHAHGAGAHGNSGAAAGHGHGHGAGVNGTPEPNESPDAAESPEPAESPDS
jgi:hypothetical protein